MSGPKISYGRLTQSAYRQAETNAKIDVCIEVCQNCSFRLDQCIVSLNDIINYINNIPDYGENEAQKKQMITNIESQIRLARKLSDEGRNIKRKDGLRKAERLNEKLTSRVGSIVSVTQSYNEQAFKLNERTQKAMYLEYFTKIDAKLQGLSFFFPFENATKVYSAQEYIEKIDIAMKEVLDLELSTSLKEDLERLKVKASEITDGNFIHNFYQISILPFVKACKEYNLFFQAHNAEFMTLKINCEVLAKELKLNVEDYELSKEALVYYRKKREELVAAVIEKRRQEYIFDCLDETMEELGYKLVGKKESTNKRGQTFQNQLFTYGEGTAVNVTFAENGQITMELAGLDVEDRIPNYEESQQLVESMNSFCNDYLRIEDRLKEKGLVNERISMMPADEDFAQIINISEYDMDQQVSKFSVDSKAVQSEQYMHQGDEE